MKNVLLCYCKVDGGEGGGIPVISHSADTFNMPTSYQ